MLTRVAAADPFDDPFATFYRMGRRGRSRLRPACIVLPGERGSSRVTPGDIVWMPFPHVEGNRMHSCPALIVASGLGGPLDLYWR